MVRGGRDRATGVLAGRTVRMVAGEVLIARLLGEASVAADKLLFVARIANVQRKIVRELVDARAVQCGQQTLADQLGRKCARLAGELAGEEAGACPIAGV